jgi:hypothetical protein
MWEDQWRRVERWFDRFAATANGRKHVDASDNYQDEVYSFFQNCYHLKDWLLNDPTTGVVRGDVEAYISASQDLSICADICNGSKHLDLSKGNFRPRSGVDTKIQGRQYSVSFGSSLANPQDETPTISVRYIVISAGHTFDAFTLAESCMKDWRTYLQGERLTLKG